VKPHHPNTNTSTSSSGSINLTIKDEKSNPLSNVIVALNPSSGENIVLKTDTNGELTMNNVSYDTYTLNIIKEGYDTITEPLTISQKSTILNYTLKVSTGNLNVSIKDNDLNPISGVNVTLTNSTDSSLTYTNSNNGTGDAGGSSINVPYGTYNLLASKTGYKDYTQNSIIVNTKNSSLNINMESST
jgi:hypothetical protein